MNADGPIVALQLESRPQTLVIVRAMLSGVAELLDMDPELLDDLKTAVSEACNNVVLHAYGETVGPMEIRLYAGDPGISVEVADAGTGIDATVSVDGAAGVGVSVIRALTREAIFATRPAGGTEVVMHFDAERDGRRLYAAPRTSAGPNIAFGPLREGEIEVTLSPVRLLTGVLGRLARTLAAGAHFSLDRFSDVYLVTDSLAAHAARAATEDRILARLSAGERRLELELGPFRPGSGAPLLVVAPDRLSSPLALLADDLSVIDGDEAESIRVVVVDARR